MRRKEKISTKERGRRKDNPNHKGAGLLPGVRQKKKINKGGGESLSFPFSSKFTEFSPYGSTSLYITCEYCTFKPTILHATLTSLHVPSLCNFASSHSVGLIKYCSCITLAIADYTLNLHGTVDPTDLGKSQPNFAKVEEEGKKTSSLGGAFA